MVKQDRNSRRRGHSFGGGGGDFHRLYFLTNEREYRPIVTTTVIIPMTQKQCSTQPSVLLDCWARDFGSW
jgi:hypothetical protein